MSLITCVSECIYQKDGYCELVQAASSGVNPGNGCIHYIPKHPSQYYKKETDKK